MYYNKLWSEASPIVFMCAKEVHSSLPYLGIKVIDMDIEWILIACSLASKKTIINQFALFGNESTLDQSESGNLPNLCAVIFNFFVYFQILI